MHDFVLVSRREKERERGAMGFDPRERGSEGGRGLGWLWGRGSL